MSSWINYTGLTVLSVVMLSATGCSRRAVHPLDDLHAVRLDHAESRSIRRASSASYWRRTAKRTSGQTDYPRSANATRKPRRASRNRQYSIAKRRPAQNQLEQIILSNEAKEANRLLFAGKIKEARSLLELARSATGLKSRDYAELSLILARTYDPHYLARTPAPDAGPNLLEARALYTNAYLLDMSGASSDLQRIGKLLRQGAH